MVAKGKFMFKCIQEREKGSFTNKETGELIKYDSCYILVADEVVDDYNFTERRFKINKENTSLINDLSNLESYTKMEIYFNVTLYSSNAKVEPIKIELI